MGVNLLVGISVESHLDKCVRVIADSLEHEVEEISRVIGQHGREQQARHQAEGRYRQRSDSFVEPQVRCSRSHAWPQSQYETGMGHAVPAACMQGSDSITRDARHDRYASDQEHLHPLALLDAGIHSMESGVDLDGAYSHRRADGHQRGQHRESIDQVSKGAKDDIAQHRVEAATDTQRQAHSVGNEPKTVTSGNAHNQMFVQFVKCSAVVDRAT